MEQKANFISRPRRVKDLLQREGGAWRPYRITAQVRLKAIDYENFATDLLADRAFLEEASGCGEEGGLIRCLCVTCRCRASLLVLPDGTGHIALAALL